MPDMMMNAQDKRQVAVGVLGGVGIEAIAMLVVVVILTSIRLCMRLWVRGWRSLRLDDALAIVGVLLYFVKAYITVLLSSQTFWLANDGMTDAHRAVLQTDDREYYLRVRGSKLFFYDWISYSTMIWTLKAAFCAYIMQQVVSPFRRLMYHLFGYVSLVLTFAVVNIYLAVGCWPVSHMWQLNPDPGPSCYPANSMVLVWIYYGFNCITTVSLGVMAMSEFFTADPSVSRSAWRVVPLFSAAVAAACSITRAIELRRGTQKSKELGASWALWEGLAIVMVINLPVIYTCWKQMSRRKTNIQGAPTNDPEATGLEDEPKTIRSRPQSSTSTSSNSSQTIVADEEGSIDMPRKEMITDSNRAFTGSKTFNSQEMTLESSDTLPSRSNSIIHQTLEVTVSEEQLAQPGQVSCRTCGNYTKTWSRDEDKAIPAQRSEYFADHIHTHTRWNVQRYGPEY